MMLFIIAQIKIYSQTSYCFENPVSYSIPSGYQPWAIKSGDFNGDGKLDLAATNTGTNSFNVTIKLGDGLGSFTNYGQVSAANSPYGLAVGDFNEDGIDDIVTCNLASQNVSVILGSSTASLSSSSYFVSIQPKGITVNDFNNDGHIDIGCVGNAGYLSVLLGTGLGTFGTFTLNNLGYQLYGITSADFNNDGKIDIAVTRELDAAISICLGNGTGSYLASSYKTVGTTPRSICSKDLNGDGNFDLVVGNLNSNEISVLLSSPQGTFSNAVNIQNSNFSPINIDVEDFNNDGILDIAVSNNNLNISIIEGIGNGVFVYNYTENFPASSSQRGSCTGDFNQDGRIDLATTEYWGDNINVMLNCYTPPPLTSSHVVSSVKCHGDCNGSVTIKAQGGTPTYSVDFSGLGVQTTNDSLMIQNLCPGTYTYSVIDGVTTVTNSFTVNEPDTIDFTFIFPNLVYCAGNCATATLVGVYGGTYPYTIDWLGTGVSTQTINLCPTAVTTYTAKVTDINNCFNYRTLTVVGTTTCQNVWPGDVDNNGVVNNFDVLELGLHINKNGPARGFVSNNWQLFNSPNWADTLSNGKKLNHSDCDGNGIINFADTVAIQWNYNQTHNFRLGEEQIFTNPQLTIVPDQTSVSKGSWGSASIYLGDSSNPINGINGVAFTINYNNYSLLQTNKIWMEYPLSFINPSFQNLDFRKSNYYANQYFAATTHTDNINTNGFGKIGILHYQVNSNLSSNATFSLSLSNAMFSNSSGDLFSLSAGSCTFLATVSVTSLNEIENFLDQISISPNPTKNTLNINLNNTHIDVLQKELIVSVYTIDGKFIKKEIYKKDDLQASIMINLKDVAAGLYFLNISSDSYSHNYKFIKE